MRRRLRMIGIAISQARAYTRLNFGYRKDDLCKYIQETGKQFYLFQGGWMEVNICAGV